MATIQIFTNQASDGDSAEFTVNQTGILKVSGSFGGGTINLQTKLADTSDSFSNTGDSFTEAFAKEIIGKKGSIYRLNLSGATAPSLNAFVEDNFA